MECAFTSPVRTECSMFVMCCMQCCMSVSAVLECVVVLSPGGIYAIVICLVWLMCTFCVVCINGRRYVCCEVMYFGRFGFRGELGFLNCDYICMCVVNKEFELLEFVLDSVYVDLQYDEIYRTFTAGLVCVLVRCLLSCGSPWSVCEVVLVPYVVCAVVVGAVVVGAVVAVIVMHVLLFVLHVCMRQKCEGARATAMLVWGPGEVWLR